MINARLTQLIKRRSAGAFVFAFGLAGCADVQAPAGDHPGRSAAFAPGSIGPGSVAFISERTGRTEVFVMNAGGDNERQVTFSPRDEALDNLRIEWIQNRPIWSPDGRKLLFTRRAWDLSVTPNALIHDIHILDFDDPDPRPRRLMNNPGASGSPAWSPDGQKVAYCSFNAGPAEIYIYDLATNASTRTTSGPGCWPDWSPDGSTIAFHTAGAGARLALLDLASGAVTYLTSHTPGDGDNDFFPRWSPDGRSLAFQSNRARDGNGTRYGSIFVMPSDGSAVPRNITPIPAGQVASSWVSQQPAWSHNGNHILFQGVRPGTNGSFQLFRTPLDGSDVASFTEPPFNNYQPNARGALRP